MKIFALCIFILSGYNYSFAQVKKQSLTVKDIYAIAATYPLYIEKMDFNNKSTIVHLADGKRSTIEFIVKSFYFNECAGDSAEQYFSMRDVYLNTILLQDSANDCYLILLKHMPGSQLCAKLLFYNHDRHDFIDPPFDFNLSSLYDIENNSIKSSNLRRLFKIRDPQLEMLTNKPGDPPSYKFMSMIHNGTSNTMQQSLITIGPDGVQNKMVSWKLH